MTVEAKYRARAELAETLKANLDAQKAKDLAADASYGATYTAQARSVLPAQQDSYRVLQERASGFNTVAQARVEIDRARAAGDSLALTAIGLHAFDTGSGADKIVPGAGQAWLSLAESALPADRVRALNKVSSHKTAGIFDMLSYVPIVR